MLRTWHWREMTVRAYGVGRRTDISVEPWHNRHVFIRSHHRNHVCIVCLMLIYYLLWERPTSYIAKKRLDYSRKIMTKRKKCQVHEVAAQHSILSIMSITWISSCSHIKHTDHRRRYHLRSLHCPAHHQRQVHLHPQEIWSCFQILLTVAGSKRGLSTSTSKFKIDHDKPERTSRNV